MSKLFGEAAFTPQADTPIWRARSIEVTVRVVSAELDLGRSPEEANLCRAAGTWTTEGGCFLG